MARTAASRRRSRRTLGVLVLAVGLALLALPPVGAATDPVPPPVTDYVTYPQPDLLPAGCSSEGPAVLIDARYTVGGSTVTSLRDVTLRAGDVVVMSWAGFAPGCEGIGVSLSVKKTNVPFFDPQDNQQLLRPYAYCGPGGVACAQGPDGRYALTLAVPPVEVTCNFQVDAAIGPPLEVVGPAGSYYSAGNRTANGKPGGPEMLISANNGGVGDCEQRITRIDKLWIVGGTAMSSPPAGLAPGFAVVVESVTADDEVLGSATCRYAGTALSCAYVDSVGAPLDALPARSDGSLIVFESDPPAGYGLEPSEPIQLADRFVSCEAGGCVLTVSNVEGAVSPATTVPPPPPTAVATTVVTGAVGGTGAGNAPPTASAASGTLPATGSSSRGPLLLAYGFVAVGLVLVLEAARVGARAVPALSERRRGPAPG